MAAIVVQTIIPISIGDVVAKAEEAKKAGHRSSRSGAEDRG